MKQGVYVKLPGFPEIMVFAPTTEGLLLARMAAARSASSVRVTGVATASMSAGRLAFGDLEHAGFLRKRYIPCWYTSEDSIIRWEVLPGIAFTDTTGVLHLPGDMIDWEP